MRQRKAWLVLPLLALLPFTTSCASSVNKVMESWMGANVNDLIASWGPPQQVFDDGSGGKVLVWAADRTWTTPGRATTNTTATVSGNTGWATSTTTYTPAAVNGYTAYRMFWANSKGTLYRWAWKGM